MKVSITKTALRELRSAFKRDKLAKGIRKINAHNLHGFFGEVSAVAETLQVKSGRVSVSVKAKVTTPGTFSIRDQILRTLLKTADSDPGWVLEADEKGLLINSVSISLGLDDYRYLRHDPQTEANGCSEDPKPGFCIFVNSLSEGPIPLWRDEDDFPFVYATRLEAEREIADDLMERLTQFMNGELEFEEAIDIEEYIVEVGVFPDGSITDEDGNVFRSRRNALEQSRWLTGVLPRFEIRIRLVPHPYCQQER